ncbi:ESRRB family protein [Megaselia abdita]
MSSEITHHRIKQEVDATIDTTSCYSPTSNSIYVQYNNGQQSPSVSPERQLCSSTTSTVGDFNSSHTTPGGGGGAGNTSEQENKGQIREEIARRLCLVCGDIASGFHYGVASCEACKAFFKRTIQGNIEYTCPANNECEINKRRRKACQACRFQKCLLMGMLKEGVRLDRVRGGRQKYRRNPAGAASYPTMQLMYQSNVTSLDDIKILEILNNYEPEQINVNDSANHQFDELNPTDILTILSGLYDKELVQTIGWAKVIPGFTELPLNHQMKLLQSSWAEILTLQLAYRSIPFKGKLIFATDFSLNDIQAKKCGHELEELYLYLVQICHRLERLSPGKEEYLILKALILSNCDIPLDNDIALRKFRESILSSLNDCVYLLRQNNATSHQQQLLLILPSLRQADSYLRKFWIDINRNGNISMNKLLVEMLESVSR